MAEFDGTTYDPGRDGERLHGQLTRVERLMADHQWRTLAEITAVVGGSEAAVSARLRDLRKPKFGGHNIEREHVENGLWRYRLTPPPAPAEVEQSALFDMPQPGRYRDID